MSSDFKFAERFNSIEMFRFCEQCGRCSSACPITGVNGLPGLAAYSGTKGALISMARAMAIDHARENIRVNSVSPGTIDSPMLHATVAVSPNPDETRRAFDEVQPRGRVGTIEEVAAVFAFLASDQASYVSGANLSVDGGMSIKSEQPRL